MIEAAKMDGRNMAALLSNITSGLIAFQAVFNGLESKYQPFADAEFRENFYKNISE